MKKLRSDSFQSELSRCWRIRCILSEEVTIRERIIRRSIGAILVFFCLAFVFWYAEAGYFNDDNVPGTYIWQSAEEASTLILRPNHTFHQELVAAGATKYSEGSWRLFPTDSQSHIALSSEFLKLPGQEKGQDGTAFGQLTNTFGFLSITFGPDPKGPTLHKKSRFR